MNTSCRLLTTIVAAALALGAGPAAAFDGIVELAVKLDGKPSEARVLLRGRDVRIDAELEGVRTSLVVLGSNTDVLCQVLHPTRTWERVALAAPRHDAERFLVEPLPPAELLGRTVKGARLTDTKSGDTFDVWLDPTLGEASVFDRVWRVLKRSDGSLALALAGAGLKGFPVKLILKRRHGGVVEVEAQRAEARTLHDEAFAPPPSYRQVSTGALREGSFKGAARELGNLFGR